ncbi:unnamed protein product [Dimorphilus gyrociliatus]|uniref:lysoplasmalogenase n=1 Tax=Dimorphilus gyrociliatus TaxID=2664684 RepID=A0A7I8VZV4_9ANNE|nr:unnamed protein product [Dimorphilus gyrociliatus]
MYKQLGIFLTTVLLYFYFVRLDPTNNDYPKEELKTVIFKILPILSLIYMVFSTRQFRKVKKLPFDYQNLILMGLIFSLMGDICLVWRIKLFIPGICLFAIGHLFYIGAQGWKPKGYIIGLVLSLGLFIMGSFVISYMKAPAEQVATSGYMVLIFVHFWRAAIRTVYFPSGAANLVLLGITVFVISDYLIVFDQFVWKVENASLYIMITYYLSQLCIACSAYGDNSHTHGKTRSHTRKVR